MDNHILQLVRQNYPQLTEKALQEEIARVGKVMQFKAHTLIQDYGTYIKLVPFLWVVY